MQDQILILALLWSRELKRHPLPDFYSLKLRYRPEPARNAAEEWVDPYVVTERGYGDCDDFVIFRLGQILAAANWNLADGIETLPAWPCVAWERGTGNYHVLIRHRDGSSEDPAKIMLKRNGEMEPN